MKASPLFFRRALFACAAVLAAVVLGLALGVIPSVQADTTPGANPEAAVPVLWVITGLHLLVAVTLAIIAFRSRERHWISTSVLVVLGLFVLLFGFALADASSAHRLGGPAMQAVSTLLRLCAAGDYLGGALVIVVPFLRPKTA